MLDKLWIEELIDLESAIKAKVKENLTPEERKRFRELSIKLQKAQDEIFVSIMNRNNSTKP